MLGKTPPPLGGVTIHVQRLLNSLKDDIKYDFNYDFRALSKKSLFLLPFIIKQYKLVHIHSSNPWVRLYIVRMCKIFKVKSVITIHGNLGRFNTIKNKIDYETIRLTDKPIVLNEQSFSIAYPINKKTELVSAFIPPDISQEILLSNISQSISKLKDKSKLLFCTNGSNLSFDKNNEEIYGIFELIEAFSTNLQYGLVFSDPSGIYSKVIKEKNIHLPDNVLVVNVEHSFYRVMQLCDASIRNTTTDGDSLSVKESLYLKRYTFVTDVVSRPVGCILYKKGKFADFLINEIPQITSSPVPPCKIVNGSTRIFEIYQEFFKT